MGNFCFKFHKFIDLPKLGWGMVIHKNSHVPIDVYCGDYVETLDDWFVSGVWDGDFSAESIDSAEFFCATGAVIRNNKVTVYSPSHERQRICYFENSESIVFSNSIPLLLAVSNESIDKSCTQYEKILCSILFGTKDYYKNIPINNNKFINQVFCADVIIDSEFNLSINPKPIHRDFIDYEDYLTSITDVCVKIKNNGTSENRKKKYKLGATASTGYDSSACAAIMYKAGCDTLFTFKGGHYDDDSAVTIAKQIGYKDIIERGHLEFKSKTDNKDAEFFVCGDIGVYLQFSAFEDCFKDHIVSIGTSGSYMWDKTGDVNKESKRSGYDFYTANLSFSENALIKGYIILPLPLYASTAVESIQKVTNLPEMKPWTLNTDYDRPICRRILETSGVDGALFGHVKYGAGFAMSKNFTLKQLKPKMSEEGFESFKKWLSVKGNNSWNIERIFKMLQYHFFSLPVYAAFVASKLSIKTSWGKGSVKYPNPGLPSKLIVWGMETLSEKYKSAMTE